MEKDKSKELDLSRREVFKVAATGLLVASLPGATALAKTTSENHEAHHGKSSATSANSGKTTYLFFNRQEAAFVEAAVARLIPADEKWGGGIEAGVPNYIDKQLGGAWGAGERLYRSGPWQAGTKAQGYQLPYTPAELFRTAIKALEKDFAEKKIHFTKMTPQQQDDYLHGLEKGGQDLEGVPSNIFFSSLWQMTVEGFLADPVYGGNRDMISWRMIGFPGAYGSYLEVVDKHNIKIDRAPMSLAEDSMGHVHPNPNIPAR